MLYYIHEWKAKLHIGAWYFSPITKCLRTFLKFDDMSKSGLNQMPSMQLLWQLHVWDVDVCTSIHLASTYFLIFVCASNSSSKHFQLMQSDCNLFAYGLVSQPFTPTASNCEISECETSWVFSACHLKLHATVHQHHCSLKELWPAKYMNAHRFQQ